MRPRWPSRQKRVTASCISSTTHSVSVGRVLLNHRHKSTSPRAPPLVLPLLCQAPGGRPLARRRAVIKRSTSSLIAPALLLPIAAVVSLTPAIRDSLRSEEHTSELQSHHELVCRLLLEKKNMTYHVGAGAALPSQV